MSLGGAQLPSCPLPGYAGGGQLGIQTQASAGARTVGEDGAPWSPLSLGKAFSAHPAVVRVPQAPPAEIRPSQSRSPEAGGLPASREAVPSVVFNSLSNTF